MPRAGPRSRVNRREGEIESAINSGVGGGRESRTRSRSSQVFGGGESGSELDCLKLP